MRAMENAVDNHILHCTDNYFTVTFISRTLRRRNGCTVVELSQSRQEFIMLELKLTMDPTMHNSSSRSRGKSRISFVSLKITTITTINLQQSKFMRFWQRRRFFLIPRALLCCGSALGIVTARTWLGSQVGDFCVM